MTPPFLARHMRLEDIPQVVTIDRASFPNPWPPHAYQFEISNRDTSHMIVIEAFDQPSAGGSSWRGLIDRLFVEQSGRPDCGLRRLLADHGRSTHQHDRCTACLQGAGSGRTAAVAYAAAGCASRG